LPQEEGVFTPTTFSPGASLRQSPSRYTIHAGRNLHGKGLRYFNTVIVTADAYWRFTHLACTLRHRPTRLTFQCWSGFSPYTSSYEFKQGPVFLINSRLGSFIEALNPCGLGQSISKTYGRCIAEFLNEVSPVHLSTLILVHLCRFAVRIQHL